MPAHRDRSEHETQKMHFNRPNQSVFFQCWINKPIILHSISGVNYIRILFFSFFPAHDKIKELVILPFFGIPNPKCIFSVKIMTWARLKTPIHSNPIAHHSKLQFYRCWPRSLEIHWNLDELGIPRRIALFCFAEEQPQLIEIERCANTNGFRNTSHYIWINELGCFGIWSVESFSNARFH